MRFSAILVALTSVAAVSAAQNFTVIVGSNGTLTYNPPSVNVSAGDTVSFQFQTKNHTVTQSTFASPCTPMDKGVDSGFQAVAAGATSVPQWSFTVNNASAPLWFYCKQTGHCAQGMVFAINPTANKSLAAFKANAMGGASGASTGSASPSATGSAAGAKPSNGAVRVGGSAAGIVTLVGLVAGMVL